MNVPGTDILYNLLFADEQLLMEAYKEIFIYMPGKLMEEFGKWEVKKRGIFMS